MSTVKTNNVQIGQSATATNNFTWYQPASPDGTVRLGNGNAGAVTDRVTVTSAGSVGIGTSSPVAQIDSYKSGSTYNDLRVRNDTGQTFIAQDNGATVFGTYSNQPVAFASNNVERMRITSDGYVLVATASRGSNTSTFYVNGSLGGHGLTGRQGNGGTSSGNVFNFWWNSTVAQLWIDNVNVGNISVTSDYRTKDHVETQIEPAIERVLQLRPVTYQIADYGTLFKADGKVREGFIAHELAGVIPSAVEGEKDDPNQIQSLRLDALCSVLTKAIQEQQAIIEDLRARLAALEAK